jgi:hypothetical protein
MISFITLTDLDSDKIELNPAFITVMRRDTYQPEDGVDLPFTKIHLSTGGALYVLETPEQIAKLQMNAVADTMAALMPMISDVMTNADF